MATTVEDILAEMIDRRAPVGPLSLLRPPRQRPGTSKKRVCFSILRAPCQRPGTSQKRVRFAADCPTPTSVPQSKPVSVKDLAAITPWEKFQCLTLRIYTPFGQLRRGVENRRLWRMKPGLYQLLYLERPSGEVTLREAGSLVLTRVRLPRRMEWPWKATHLKISEPGEHPLYPRGKAEWVRR